MRGFVSKKVKNIINSAIVFMIFLPPIQAIALTLPNKHSDPLIQFALDKVDKTLKSVEGASSTKQLKLIPDTALSKQGFSLTSQKNNIIIKASDSHGFMYGLMELNEQLLFGNDLSQLAIEQTPFIKKRGLKFNVPLDARNPSYDDTGDAAQKNIATVWDFEFWKAYLDRMAEHRYNQLTLWNPQPFTSMLKLNKYPGLALDDVYVSDAPLNKKVGVWGEAGGVTNLVLGKMTKVKKITIDEKINHWKKVMAYAKFRGIDVHFITWSIYTNGINGYGIDEKIDNPNTIAFFREAVKEMILTYPDLKGVGITAGERMPSDGQVENWSREKWLWQSYGLGLQDAKKVNPSRKIDFMHRFWYSGYADIAKYWSGYPDHFSFSFKYLMARIYSSPQPSHIAANVLPMLNENPDIKTWWNLRNDDIFVYRWGNPDYVKTFYKNLPMRVTEGIHMGSDGYVWAKSFSDKVIDNNNYLEIDKHWYKFMMWGRLAYNKNLPSSFFENQLSLKFPSVNKHKLYKAWQAASEIVPAVNRYQFQPGDRKFSPETSSSRETFRYVNDFQVARSMPKSGQLNSREYVKAILKNSDLKGKTSPIDLAQFMEDKSNLALSLVKELHLSKKAVKALSETGAELNRTLDDIKAFSYLGLYYAAKIRSATALEFYEKTGQQTKHKKQALQNIEQAITHFYQYKTLSEKNYHPQMLARVNRLDWTELNKEVQYEKEIVLKKLATPFQIPTTNDPKNQLSISYDAGLIDEHRHQRMQINTPDNGNFMVEVYEEDGVYINNYHSKGKGDMRWEWIQERPKGRIYYLNLKWNGNNRVIKVIQ